MSGMLWTGAAGGFARSWLFTGAGQRKGNWHGTYWESRRRGIISGVTERFFTDNSVIKIRCVLHVGGGRLQCRIVTKLSDTYCGL